MRYQSVVFKFAQDDEETRLALPQEESEAEEESSESCQECGEAVTAEEMRDPGHQDDRGRFYCGNCVSECGGREGGCSEKHPISEMLQGMSTREFYCEECFNDLFVYCPQCARTVDKNDFYPPTRKNQRRGDPRSDGGCYKCSKKCEYCDCVLDEDDVREVDGDIYCETCLWDHFTMCEGCSEHISHDDSNYVEGDGSYCNGCFRDKFYICQGCDQPVEKTESIKFEYDWYHTDCVPESSILDLEIDATAFPEFSYTKKDKFLTPLMKLLPISPKDLKAKNPTLSAGLKDLINFSKGKILTAEMVEDYRKTLNPEEFPVQYYSYRGDQRSVRSSKPQPTLQILASPQILNKLNQDSKLIDLFNNINKVSASSNHPHANNQLGWARIEISPDKEYMLVDEIQIDHMNAVYQLKYLKKPELVKVKEALKSRYNLNDLEFEELLNEYFNIFKDFPNIASIAVEKFARQNGIKRIFWHTYESGVRLKGNDPPKSLYTTTPKEHFYLPSGEKPFGLEGEFFSKEAKRAYMLYKLAKFWNKKY